MSGLVSELIKVITQEADYYDQLIKISTDKKIFIINNDINALKDITCTENTLAGKMQRLEKKRLSLIVDIANVLNEKEDNITLSYLADIITDPPQVEEMKDLTVRLKKSITALKELNEQNKVLIENALEYIDFSMNVIRSTLDSSPTIFNSKGEELTTSMNLFDVRN